MQTQHTEAQLIAARKAAEALLRRLMFVRDDLNSELDYETRLLIDAAIASANADGITA